MHTFYVVWHLIVLLPLFAISGSAARMALAYDKQAAAYAESLKTDAVE